MNNHIDLSKNAPPEIVKVIKSIPDKLGGIYSWLRSKDNKPFVDALATLGSFAMGDPTGLALPTILNCGDSFIRKRAQKHLPDLAKILVLYNPQFNMKIVQSEFGQQLLRDVIDKIIHEIDEQKIHYLKSFLICTYLQPTENYSIFQKYKDMLFQMDPVRLQILHVLSQPKEHIPKIIQQKIKTKKIGMEIEGFKIPYDYNQILNFEQLLFEQSFSELKTQGLLKNSGSHTVGLGGKQLTDEIAPVEQLGVEFNHSKELVKQYSNPSLKFKERTDIQIEIATVDFITDFGWGFIQFFKAPSNSLPESK